MGRRVDGEREAHRLRQGDLRDDAEVRLVQHLERRRRTLDIRDVHAMEGGVDGDPEPRLQPARAHEGEHGVRPGVDRDELRPSRREDQMRGWVDRDAEPATVVDRRDLREGREIEHRDRLVGVVRDVEAPRRGVQGQQPRLHAGVGGPHARGDGINNRDGRAAVVRNIDTPIERIDDDAERLMSDRIGRGQGAADRRLRKGQPREQGDNEYEPTHEVARLA